jgi:Leucine-rich repeat (LRR) protein
MSIPSWLQEHCFRLSVKDEQLTNLNLNIRKLDSQMMKALAASLRDNPFLVVLNLTSSLANDETALTPLAQSVLPYHQSLQVIHLSYNRLTDVGAIGLALGTNKMLTELFLDYNQVGAASAHYIADGLRQNTKLQGLQLSHNKIRDKGCQANASALRKNYALLTSRLDRNGITDIGAASLLSALEKVFRSTESA